MLIDVGLRVLYGNGPLLVPPVRLGHHAAVDHGEPVIPPEVDIDRRPVAVVANFFWIEHQRAVGTSLRNVGLQANFRDGFAVAVGEFLAELVHVHVIIAGEDFAERGESGGHRNRIGVVGATVEDLVLRDEVHHGPAGADRSQGDASADRFGAADHVRLHVEILTGSAPAELGAGFYFVEDQERAVFRGQVAKALQKAGLRYAEADVHENWFQNDRGDLAGILFEATFDGGKVV